MGDLEDTFAWLLGQQPSDKDRQNPYRVRDALKVKATDSVWLLFMALQYYLKLYEEFPGRIEAKAREVTQAVRATAEAEARAAQEETKKMLMEAVRQAAVKSATDAATAELVKWVSIAVGVVATIMLIIGFVRPATRDRASGGDGMDHLPPVLTTREAANALRIGVKEVRKLVDAGDIPAARFGPRRVIRIARSALERILRGDERRRT